MWDVRDGVRRRAAARGRGEVRVAERVVLHVDDGADALGGGERGHRAAHGGAARRSPSLGKEDEGDLIGRGHDDEGGRQHACLGV